MRNKLVEFRQKLGLTQEEIGALVGKSRVYWCLIETGRMKGSPEFWINLQIKFNLTAKETIKLMEVVE